MGSRRAPRSPRRGLFLGVVLAVLLTAAAVAVGAQLLRPTGGTGGAAPRATPSRPSTAMQAVDLRALPIPRGPFCDLLNDDSLATALGGRPSSSNHYGNGDEAQLAPGVKDVSHEYGCSYDATTGAQARTWVFAPPVQTGEAHRLGKQAAQAHGCHAVPGGPRFGRPTATTACKRKGATEVTLQGLFGDAWFSCQLTLPGPGSAATTVHRAQRWCVHVAETVGSRP